MERFDYYKVEVQTFDGPVGYWRDITADVLTDPRPRFSRGGDNGPSDLLASAGQFTFSLDNSEMNSAGLIGYYTPGHANASHWNDDHLGLFRTGLPVRLSFAYDSFQPYYKWYGRIDPNGLRITPGIKGPRRVDVTCHDFLYQATYYKMNLPTSQSNKYFHEAVAAVIANMPIQPLRVQLDNDGGPVFTTVFDGTSPGTTALGEFEKMAQSQRRRIFTKGDLFGGETFTAPMAANLVIPMVTSRCGALLLETGDQLLLETGGTDYLLLDEVEAMSFDDSDIVLNGTDISYGTHIVNSATTTRYPRKTDAAATTVLWTLRDAVKIAPATTQVMRGRYVDPVGGNNIWGTDFVDPPVSGTDYKANANATGTGADKTADLVLTATFGDSEVQYSMENIGAADIYIGGSAANCICRARGRGVYFYDTIRTPYENATSIGLYGLQPLNIDMKYRNEEAVLAAGRTTAQAIVNQWKDPQPEINKLGLWANRDSQNMCAFLFGEPNTYATVTEAMNGLSNTTFLLVGYEAEIAPGNDGTPNVLWYPRFRIV